MKKLFFVIIFLIIILYLLFSTNAINNRIGSPYKHLILKKSLSLEINGLYKFFNPSITKCGNNYIVCSRYSNKTLRSLFSYIISDINYQSDVCIMLLTSDMKISKIIFPIITSNHLEDPRIHFHNNKYYISITEFKSKKHIMPVLYILDINFNFMKRVEYNVTNYFINKPPSFIQKNWCPFSHQGQLVIHTDTYPVWKVMKIDDNGVMNVLTEIDTSNYFKSSKQKIIRCSTSWKHFSDKTYICGLHTKQFWGKFPTIRTILVEIDIETLKPLRKTEVFCVDYINNTRIQFLSGLEVDDLNVYLTYGVGDYKMEIVRITKQTLKRLLK